ncbi:MAG: anaerobic ribonucleoside-triphosphate reductase activating protein [Oscillospiraceae bacterium]|nr:anaerobic ribonucleoside-triphosphate reductase activating protein [Oscillospiraceae bacterium]
MKIYGLQKMTLLDYPGHVACTVFLGGCDFRCPFCHNFELADGTAQPEMDEAQLLAFLEKRKGLLDGVAITGGEPCLHRDLPALMGRIQALGFGVKLDTNGMHPELLQEILQEKLADYVAMDIKNSPDKYAVTSGVAEVDMEKIRRSIRLIRELAPDYEFRTTVVKEFHEAADFEAMGKEIEGAKQYFLQCFTDRDTGPFGNLHAPSKAELEAFAAIARRYVPETRLRGVD